MQVEDSITAWLQRATATLEAVSESPRLDAEILLARAIDVPRSYLFAHPEDTLDAGAIARLKRSIARRAAFEPLAYITGRKEFWSLELIVTPDTLVPRPESELLVELALRELPRKASLRVLDLGTGCGAIALAIASERPLCNLVATDASDAALRVAQENARQLEIANIEFVAGRWTEPLAGPPFDLIVSNPPYVQATDPVLKTLRSEPLIALVAGDDGLADIRILARDCPAILQGRGKLLLEHGSEQGAAVAKILSENGWVDIVCVPDYAGLPRVTTAARPALDNKL
jgi:release factor glutamine methyltransferase